MFIIIFESECTFQNVPPNIINSSEAIDKTNNINLMNVQEIDNVNSYTFLNQMTYLKISTPFKT